MTMTSMLVRAVLLAVAGSLLQYLFIKEEHDENWVRADLLKGTASLMFVLIGLMGFLKLPTSGYFLFVYLGLVFGALGDLLLNLRYVYPANGQKIFLGGILVFLIGHIFYLVAQLPLCPKKLPAVLLGCVLTAVTLFLVFRVIEAKPAFKIFGVFYLGAIIILTVVSVWNFFTYPNVPTALFALGTILFTASDIILILNTFGGEQTYKRRIANLSLYYAGQLLIAFSLLFIKV